MAHDLSDQWLKAMSFVCGADFTKCTISRGRIHEDDDSPNYLALIRGTLETGEVRTLLLVTREFDGLLEAADELAKTVNRVVHPQIVREVLADYREARRKYDEAVAQR